MNASEQIALLRRACEILWEWYGGKLSVTQFHDKWCPQGMSAVEFTRRAYNEAMLATATPPDDDKRIRSVVGACHIETTADAVVRYVKETTDLIAKRVRERDEACKERDALKEEVDWLAREWPSQVAAAIGSTPSRAGATPSMLSGCVQHEVARLAKERDDALAKLAAKEKELADIYAAKPEPEFKAEGLRVYQRTTVWSEIASCRAECTAKDIADALNGGKP